MIDPLDIVIAEDDFIQRSYLTQVLKHLGYNVLPAEDGLGALDLLKSSKAQILITDLQMPEMNGIELTRAVREAELGHYVHIIMLTGGSHKKASEDALEAGVDDFMTKGDDPTRLKARIRVASRLARHASEQAEQHRILKEANDRIQKDMKAAADAQRQLLPDIRRSMQGISIASVFEPSAVVSGDMFGCLSLTENKLGVYAVDVSGHGIHASLLSVAIGHLITPEFFTNTAFDANGAPDPAAFVANLNTRFSAADNDDYFTMFCAVIDTDTGHMDYCQAGYPSPTYVASNGTARLIGEGGFPVGMFDHFTYDNDAMTFDEGDLLVLCSDAATEAETPQGEPFGKDRLNALIGENHLNDICKIPENIAEQLHTWREGQALEDDLTVLALRRKQTQ
ncbi:PP2C family protein-serine/threonine phosphatase [Celeribacter sp.]|uniref:PP2C family protein-serine/threonine phosphatase n=1 Tax=Celeribacter sp. TaxID=1890673 RepID=UPI003A942570